MFVKILMKVYEIIIDLDNLLQYLKNDYQMIVAISRDYHRVDEILR